MSSKLKIKNSLALRVPSLLKALQQIHFLYLYYRSSRKAFTQMYRKNGWFVCESASGPGSTLGATEPFRAMLPEIIRNLNVRSLLDAGCGDFNWMKEVDLRTIEYIRSRCRRQRNYRTQYRSLRVRQPPFSDC